MAQTQKLVTTNFKVFNAERFIQSVTDRESTYYVFAGKHTPYEPDDSVIQVPNNSIQSVTYSMTDNMIFGKRLTSQDVVHMIDRNEWTSGNIYDEYNNNTDLTTKTFYVYAPDGANWNIYKCLSNGSNNVSTVMPTGRDHKPVESPVDGYIWHYMTTVEGAYYNKFKTPLYAPITANTVFEANTTPGTIDCFKITDGGLGYDNFFVGSFRQEDLRLGGVDTTYSILESASSINDFYQGCVIKMTSGAAAGEYREIVNYTIEDNKKKIFLASAFTNRPLATDTYEIYPLVYVFADGNQTANCVARAIIDSGAGNSVSQVEVLDPGRNIRAADAFLIVKSVVGVSANAVLTPVISPPGGHGSDSLRELGANKVGVVVKFDGTESGFIPAANDYRTVGILKDPLFNNLILTTSTPIGAFIVGETVSQYRAIRLTGTVATNSTTTVTGTSTLFDDSLVAGDRVLVSDGSSQNFSTTVASVASNTSLTLSSAVPFTASNYYISIVKTGRTAEVLDVNTGSITVTNVDIRNVLADVDGIIGDTSSSTAVVTDQSLNGFTVGNSIETFLGVSTLVGEITSGAYEEDENVSQPSALVVTNAANPANTYANVLLSYQPVAKYHSSQTIEGDDLVYVTNLKRIFNNNETITGEVSDATLLLSNKYNGDLIKDSGQVLYVENVDPISRAGNKSETIKIILEF